MSPGVATVLSFATSAFECIMQQAKRIPLLARLSQNTSTRKLGQCSFRWTGDTRGLPMQEGAHDCVLGGPGDQKS